MVRFEDEVVGGKDRARSEGGRAAGKEKGAGAGGKGKVRERKKGSGDYRNGIDEEWGM